jgi:RNA polymerase sigma-70 factor (ECF subfamily)
LNQPEPLQARAPGIDPEAELLVRMVRGDEAALVALYTRAGSTVHACCLRILGDPDDTKDVTAETFWRLWTRAASFDPERCSGMAWILTIARRRALDRRRGQQRRRSAYERAGALPRPQPDATFEAVTRAGIAEALSRLSARDRQLLEAAYFEGLTGSDIAARDHVPLGTVKSRMRAALARLRITFQGGRA